MFKATLSTTLLIAFAVVLPNLILGQKTADDPDDQLEVCFNGSANLRGIVIKNPDTGRRCFGKSCVFPKSVLMLEIIADDPENDVLTYSYKTSAGKILGNGSKVEWDLRDVAPGIYSLDYSVDDGVGILPQTMDRIRVEIVEELDGTSDSNFVSVDSMSQKVQRRFELFGRSNIYNVSNEEEDLEDDDDVSGSEQTNPPQIEYVSIRKVNGRSLCKNEGCVFKPQLVDVNLKLSGARSYKPRLAYEYQVTAEVSGGSILGTNNDFQWDLRNVPYGTYALTLTLSDPFGVDAPIVKTIEVAVLSKALPTGFKPSKDPVSLISEIPKTDKSDKYGFLFQGPVGRNNIRVDELTNHPAVITDVTIEPQGARSDDNQIEIESIRSMSNGRFYKCDLSNDVPCKIPKSLVEIYLPTSLVSSGFRSLSVSPSFGYVKIEHRRFVWDLRNAPLGPHVVVIEAEFSKTQKSRLLRFVVE